MGKVIAIAAAGLALAFVNPAMAGNWCSQCKWSGKNCSTTSTTSSTGGTTSTTGGTTSSSGGTSVPEPGMIGLMGAGLLGLGLARRRKTRR